MTPQQSYGILFIVAAPSGAGKTSLVNALIAALDNIKLSISHTTRAKRPGEIDGVHYHFVTQAEFDAMVKAGEFLEHAKVFEHSYGTSKNWVIQQLKQGIDVILEIDWQGAAQVRHSQFHCVSIFILPPSRAALEERLKQRGQDGPLVIANRMIHANSEMSHCQEFEHVVINDRFDEALKKLEGVIQAYRTHQPVEQTPYQELLADLLKKG